MRNKMSLGLPLGMKVACQQFGGTFCIKMGIATCLVIHEAEAISNYFSNILCLSKPKTNLLILEPTCTSRTIESICF